MEQFYKILGGIGTALLIGVFGRFAGAYAGARGKTGDEATEGAFKGALIGGGVANAGSIVMGVMMRKRPGCYAAGIAQIVTSSIGLTLTGLVAGGAIELPSGEVPASQVASLFLPAKVGKVMAKERGKGVPRADIERAREHYPELATLADDEIADKLASGEITLPERGRGLIVGKAA